MRMVLCLVGFVGVAMLATGQTASAPPSNWLAKSINRNGSVMTFDGDVRIAGCAVITADHAVGGPDASETTVSGNVRVRLTNGVDPLK